jgi:transposase-like protein
MGNPNKCSPKVQEQTARMILDHHSKHDSQCRAICSIVDKIGCPAETLRKWLRRAETTHTLFHMQRA